MDGGCQGDGIMNLWQRVKAEFLECPKLFVGIIVVGIGAIWAGFRWEEEEARRWDVVTPDSWRGVYVTLDEDNRMTGDRVKVTVTALKIVWETWFGGEHNERTCVVMKCRRDDGGFTADIKDGRRVMLRQIDDAGLYRIWWLEEDGPDEWLDRERITVIRRY